MKIKILDKTDRKTILEAWCISRPALTNNTLEEVQKLDLPVNEFQFVYLDIECTILEREIFASMREHIMWAQGSRINDPRKFELPESLNKYKKEFNKLRLSMQKESETDYQDNWRTLTPILSLTRFSFGISIRKLVKLARYFNELSIETEDIDVKNILKNSYTELIKACEILGFSETLIEHYKPMKLLTKNSIDKNSVDFVSGEFAVLLLHGNVTMRTHLIRHRELLISDNMYEIITKRKVLDMTLLRSPMIIQINGKTEDLKNVISKRSCWIAQYGLWKEFVGKFSAMIEETTGILPCASGKCPFNEDAKARYSTNDPNPPCPIHARLNNIPLSTADLASMSAYAKNEKRLPFWFDEINKFSNGDQA